MKRYMLVLISMLLLFVISASAVTAAQGKIRDAFPPGNNGASPGVGLIEETIDGVPQGRPYFVFHTPDDNLCVELPVGTAVTFDAVGQKATNVQRDSI